MLQDGSHAVFSNGPFHWQSSDNGKMRWGFTSVECPGMHFVCSLCDGNARAASVESCIGIETGCNPAEMLAVAHYSLNETDLFILQEYCHV